MVTIINHLLVFKDYHLIIELRKVMLNILGFVNLGTVFIHFETNIRFLDNPLSLRYLHLQY